MKVSAIISEYNPFHNGHKYHIDETKRLTEADYVIAIMSGNFVQRGAPAIRNKYERSFYALPFLDAVFEIPTIYSVSNAGDYAMGAVSLIDSLKTATHLSFGIESGDIDSFKKIADIITKEPADFKSSLLDHIKEGLSYPRARSMALSDTMGKEAESLISSPNNILAVEYIAALQKLDSNIIPVPVVRKGSYTNNNPGYGFLSASSIRNMLKNGEDIRSHIPATDKVINKGSCLLSNESLDSLLSYKLSVISNKSDEEKYNELHSDKEDDIHEMSGDMFKRLISIGPVTGFDECVERLKSKSITYTRASRALINLILGIKENDFKVITKKSYSHYANLLGLKKSSSNVLKYIYDNSDIPIINKKSDYRPKTDEAKLMRKYDLLASDIYNILYKDKTGITLPRELSSNVTLLE